jgi:hypothetical protein
VQDREKPSPQIGTEFPEILFGDGSSQADLNQIVGACYVPSQGACITTKAWHLRFEQPSEIAHRATSFWHYVHRAG